MKQVKWTLLVYAVLAAACIMGIGIAIAEKSLIGAIGCIIGIIVVMGLGFTTKKRMRENGEL
jgi:arginine exporter protein ArgO